MDQHYSTDSVFSSEWPSDEPILISDDEATDDEVFALQGKNR